MYSMLNVPNYLTLYIYICSTISDRLYRIVFDCIYSFHIISYIYIYIYIMYTHRIIFYETVCIIDNIYIYIFYIVFVKCIVSFYIIYFMR